MKGCGCIDAMSTLLPRCCCFCQANSGGFGGGSFANAGASAGGFGGGSFANAGASAGGFGGGSFANAGASAGGFGGGSFANAGASAGGFGGSSFAQVQTGVTFTRLSVLFVSLDIIMCAEAGIIDTESRELETC
jgi:hypothetical protein